MNTRTKNCIRIVVLTALLAWPGVETCRLIVAKTQLSASQEQQRTVSLRLAQVKGAHVASQPAQP